MLTSVSSSGDILNNAAIEKILNGNHSTHIVFEPTLYERIAHKIAAKPSLTTLLRKRNVSNYAYERLQNVLFKTDENEVLKNKHDSAMYTAVSPEDHIYQNMNKSASTTLNSDMTNLLQHDSNLTSTITSIRTNVTRLLNIYFHNGTNVYGYKASTTVPIINIDTSRHKITGFSSPLKSLSATATHKSVIFVANNTTIQESNQNVSRAMNKLKAILLQNTTNALENINASTSALITSTTNSFKAPHTTEIPTTIIPNTEFFASTVSSITYPTYSLTIRSYQNCSNLFAEYTQPQEGLFCNWTWDTFLCWPPTPAGVLARMHCPEGLHGIDTKKFANRKCELDGRWGSRPNDTSNNANGWTDYQPCFKPEVYELMQQMKNLDTFLDIARRTRNLEIVGLVLSLLALIISLIIFCNFRSLRNNRTKIHKNLFIAMVMQVIVRLTLYLDQAFRRGKDTIGTNSSYSWIEKTPFLCESLYVLLEYARTTMFMWMFIEGLYLHMVTVAFFQGRFPFKIFTSIGWGIPIFMTTIWAGCTASFTNSQSDCWWNYNLTPYYWILEGPRLIVILLNFFFLVNIIFVLVNKLRQTQASDIEQTRKAVRAAIVLLPLLGITNLLHLVPDLNTPWKFAIWSYVTHFLTSFQGFFIALIYCFLNGEVRAVLLKSLAVYMSVRGHPEWVPKRVSMYSAAYNTAPETEAPFPQHVKRYESPPTKRYCRKTSTTTIVVGAQLDTCSMHLTTPNSSANKSTRLSLCAGLTNSDPQHSKPLSHSNKNNISSHINTSVTIATASSADNYNNKYSKRSDDNPNNFHQNSTRNGHNSNWIITLCLRGKKVLGVPAASSTPPESVIFELSEQ